MPTADNPLRFVHISDTHINPDTSYNKSYATYTPLVGARALVRELQALPFQPDFILHTGDVAFDPVPDVYQAVRDVFAEIDIPIHYLVGNHDDSRQLQRELIGRAEADLQACYHYDVHTKGVQLVCLDSTGDHDPEKPSGSVTQAQLDWLASICQSSETHPLVVAIHHNVLPAYVPWLDDWMRLENGAAVHDILQKASHRLCVVLHGHIHQNVQVQRDGVFYVAGGSSWCAFTSYPDPTNTRLIHNMHTLPSFNLVTVSDTTTSIIRHAFTVDDAS